jgi:hypothetical protein
MDYLKIDEIEFFQYAQTFQPHYGTNIYSASNRNEYQKLLLGCKSRPELKTDNLIANC